MATMPAKAGAPTEVPPTGDKFPVLSLNPLVQLVAVEPVAACEQTSKPSWFGEAVRETSGTSRWASAGVSAVCHDGLAKTVLTPPPLAESPNPAAMDAVVSFHAISGM